MTPHPFSHPLLGLACLAAPCTVYSTQRTSPPHTLYILCSQTFPFSCVCPFRSVWHGIRLFCDSSSLYVMVCLKSAYLFLYLARTCISIYIQTLQSWSDSTCRGPRWAIKVCTLRHSRGTRDLVCHLIYYFMGRSRICFHT